jgi:phage FluMu protein Com
MNINKLNWGECPECKTLINGWKYYPASVPQDNNGFWHEMECPKCKESLIVNMRVEATITLERAADE